MADISILSLTDELDQPFLNRYPTTELPQNAETGAPRADANDEEKAGIKLAKKLDAAG